MDLDEIVNKISDFMVTLQQFTNLWVFHATKDVRQDDVASVLPPEKGTSEDVAVLPSAEAPVQKVSVTKASVRELKLWWLCTILFMVSLMIYVLFFSPY